MKEGGEAMLAIFIIYIVLILTAASWFRKDN